MTTNTNDAHHDCADRGCLATMLGLDLDDADGVQHSAGKQLD